VPHSSGFIYFSHSDQIAIFWGWAPGGGGLWPRNSNLAEIFDNAPTHLCLIVWKLLCWQMDIAENIHLASLHYAGGELLSNKWSSSSKVGTTTFPAACCWRWYVKSNRQMSTCNVTDLCCRNHHQSPTYCRNHNNNSKPVMYTRLNWHQTMKKNHPSTTL